MISPLAHVDPSAKIGKNVTVYPFAYIDKNVEIGDNCTIMPTPAYWTAPDGNRQHRLPKRHPGRRPAGLQVQGEDTILVIGNDNTIREKSDRQPGYLSGRRHFDRRRELPARRRSRSARYEDRQQMHSRERSQDRRRMRHRRQGDPRQRRYPQARLPHRQLDATPGRMPGQQGRTALHRSRAQPDRLLWSERRTVV